MFVDESAEPVSALDRSRRWVRDPELSGGLIGRLEVERAVRPMAGVVVGKHAEHTLEVASVHDPEPVETLGAESEEMLRDPPEFARHLDP
jgi:hypothetical protein